MPAYEYDPKKTAKKKPTQTTYSKTSAPNSLTNQVISRPTPVQSATFDPARTANVAGGATGPYSEQSTGSPTTGGAGSSGNGAPYGGFASQYLPGPGAAEILQRQPEVVLADVMRQMGMSPNGGAYGMVEPSADFANALYMLTNGGQLGTNEQMINWMGNYFGNQLTPGAAGINVQGAMGNIFNPAAGGPLESFLQAGQDPRTQVSALDSLVQAAAGYGVPLIMQRALDNQMNLMGRDYLSKSARGGMSTGNYNDYIASRQNMLTPFVGQG